ncbi:MAG: hypothetical protein M3295_05850 [Chloroflexota bacterium]|nr:hypothetical protein [Chloroflexota bacterium]
MRRLVRLYPAAWRARYGDEFAALLDELRPTLPLVLDVVRGAVDARLRPQSEEVSMVNTLPPVASGRAGLAAAAIALVAPLVFVTAVWLKYGLGNGGLFDPLAPFFTSRPGELVVVLGPLVALVACAWALARVQLVRDDGRLVGVISVRISAAGLALAVLSAALVALFAFYYVAENV